MKSLLRKLGAAIGLDRAIFNVVAGRFWSLIAGPVSIFLIARRLSPEEQGYYYTFYSVLAAKIFLELGLISVVMQFASHEMGGLRWEGARLVGDPASRARLADLLRKSVCGYFVIALLLVCALLPAGMVFLGRHNGTAAAVINWTGPWISLVIMTAISMAIAPMAAIIEGCGRVAEVTRVRMFEGMATGVGLWIGLLAGAKLYSASVASFSTLMVTSTWLVATKRHTIAQLFSEKFPSTLSWKQEILPLQWRTGVAWASWYFASQLFTPAVFASLGPDIAGRLGMTLNLINVVGATSLAWMQTKAAPFGQMVARRDWNKLDQTYRRAFWQTMIMWGLGCAGLLVLITVLTWFGHPIAQRIIDLPTTLVFMVAAGMNQVVVCRSIYQRAHKAELLYGLHFANGFVVGGILLLTSRLGLFYIAIAYVFCACLPLLLISRLIFVRFRRKMHA